MQSSIPTTSLSTAEILTAGKATFTLEGKGRRFTFRIEKSESGDWPIYFVSLLTGPDNGGDFTYLGIFDPDIGWMRLTRASKLPVTSEPVRAFRWAIGCVFNLREHELDVHGFTMGWSNRCQRCGGMLTVPSSIDARLGPECARLV
jgi:Family of unknown function (DUF6011)